MTSQKSWFFGGLTFCSVLSVSVFAADNTPPMDQLMARKPIQKDVEFETPKPDEYSKCKCEAEQKGKSRGWVVTGPNGQILRKFLDTDSSGKLDQYRFYNHGVEVYRDIDTNNNDKIDEFRWLNRGGTRWGVSLKEDGHIDKWKVLSAAETSREAIRAMVAGDTASLQALMVTPEDMKSLGVNPQLASRLLESAGDAGKKAKSIMDKSKVLTRQSVWSRFDAQSPSTIPVEEEKANVELQIYESANAIIESGKDPSKRFDAVQIGEMLCVGDVWKLTQVPIPIEGDSVSSSPILMEPLQVAAGNVAAAPPRNPKVEKIAKELEEIEKRILQQDQTPAQIKNLMATRGKLIREAIDLAETDDEKLFLTKQNIDGLALAIQFGTYTDGLAELKAIESDAKKNPKSTILPYVTYRLIQAEYAISAQNVGEGDDKKDKEDDKGKEDKKEQHAEIQKQWMDSLEKFIQTYPNADDTDDAMFTLANHEEYQGRTKEAASWYQRLIAERPKSEMVERSKGAVRRLDLTGKPPFVKGPMLTGGEIDLGSLKGKVVLIVFWNGNFKLCVDDVPQLRALYQENNKKGFEIIGIAVEDDKTAAQTFVKSHNITWPQIFQPGGQNSPLAVGYGIVSYPTMFLVGKDGKVINRNATLIDVKTELPDLLKGASAAQSTKPVVQNPNPASKSKPK